MVLFKNLNYIFFLVRHDKQNLYRLSDPYEGAYLERRSLLNELKLVTRVENRFDQMAGKVVDGVRIIARLSKDTIKKGEAAIANLIIQNVSGQEKEIYHNQVSYFILFHIIDEYGNIVPSKYPRKNSIPPLEKKYFLKLVYFTTPPFDLQEYCRLTPGKYNIYVEFHLPPEYIGQNLGKKGWAGKVMSNKLELTVTE